MAECANPNCSEPIYRRGLCMVDDLRTPEIPDDAPLRVAQLQHEGEAPDPYAWPPEARVALEAALNRPQEDEDA